MTLVNYFIMLVCSIIALILSISIFGCGIKHKENLMSVEKCNFKDCDLYTDKEQC